MKNIKTFELEIFDGHPIIRHDENIILIDTGAPATIHNSDILRFMGTEYPVESKYLGLSIENLSELLGLKITTLLGIDIISKFKVLFDYNNKEVTFGEKKIEMEGTEIPISFIVGVPIIELEIDNKVLNFYLDTGAKLSYLKKKLTENFESKETIEDFHPFVGKFKTAKFDIITTLGNINFNVKYGNLPETLQLAFIVGNIDGIIGHDFFNNFKVMLDIGNKSLKYIRIKNNLNIE